ncbi:MAG: lipopolysaccharide biosynthesis protein [Bacteroidota bacterium]
MFDELKKLLKQSSIYGVGAVISPLISFIMLPIYTRFLTPEDYGVLALTNVVTLTMTAVVGLGIRSGIMRIYYTYSEKKDRDSVIITSLFFSFAVSILFSLTLHIFSPYIAPRLFNVKECYYILDLVSYSIVFSILGGNLLAVLRTEEKSKAYIFVTTTSLVLTMLLNIFFVVVLKRKVAGVLEAGLIATFVIAVGNAIYTIRDKKLSLSFSKLKEVLGFGIPLVPALIADITLSLSDRYFLEHYTSLSDVGLYSLGYRIAAMLSILVTKPFNMAWPPYMFKTAEKKNAPEIYKNVLVYYLFVAAWVGSLLSLFSREALMIVATSAYYGAYKIVPIIVVSYILVGIEQIMVAGLHITKKTKYAGLLFIITAAINLLFNFLLIPGLGMMGAALSTIISYIFLDSMYLVVSQKFYPINHDFGRIFKIFFAFTLVSAGTYMNFFGSGIVLPIVFKALLGFSFPLILLLIGFFRREEIAKLKQILSIVIVPVFNSLSIRRNRL